MVYAQNFDSNQNLSKNPQISNQPQSQLDRPALWVSDLGAVLSLSKRFATFDLFNIPESQDIPKAWHIILVDAETPEATIRQAIYQIKVNGSNPVIYRSRLPLIALVAEESTTTTELCGQILQFAVPWETWQKSKVEEKLSTREAAEIARVVIDYSQFPQLELEELRKRCNASSWDWKGIVDKLRGATTNKSSLSQKFTKRLAAEKAKLLLTANLGEIEENLQLEDLREACEMKSWEWETKIIKPLKRDLEAARFKLDLLALLQIDDPIERIRQQALIAHRHQIASNKIDFALAEMKRRTETPKTQSYELDELLNLESEALEWQISELLPKGESIILAGAPKVGKTQLAFDAAFALATGESKFLDFDVKRGKVLLVCPDQSLQSTKAKLLKRGFRREDKGWIRIVPHWTIDQLNTLEKILEDFRPDVVIVDSLRRINHGSHISENSAEFADNLYTLKETIGRYGASGIIIHHTSKDKEAMGVGKIRGSSAIAGAVWGTWQLEHIPKPDPNNKNKLIIDPKDPKRSLSVFSRDAEGQLFNIEFQLEDHSWEKEAGEQDADSESLRERIFKVLNLNPKGLRGREVIELMGFTPEEGRGIYTELNRMVEKRIITYKQSPVDKRANIYLLPDFTQTPPPPQTEPVVEYYAETITTHGFDNTQPDTQQILNNFENYSTSHEEKNAVEYLNADVASDSEILNNLTPLEGGGVVKKSVENFVHESKVTEDLLTELRKTDLEATLLGNCVTHAEASPVTDIEYPHSPSPNDFEAVEGNVEFLRECITEMSGEAIAYFTQNWSMEFKTTVSERLSPDELSTVENLAPGVLPEIKKQSVPIDPEQLPTPTCDLVAAGTKVWVFRVKDRQWVPGFVEEIESDVWTHKPSVWIIRLSTGKNLTARSLEQLRLR